MAYLSARRLPLVRLALAVAIALFLLAPAAQAQDITVTTDDIVPDLQPGGPGHDLVVHLSVACSEVLPFLALEPAVVFTAPEMPAMLVLGGDLEPPVPVADCQGAATGRLAWDHILNLSAKADAPGLETLEGVLVATIDRPAAGALTGEGPFRARPAYVGGLQIEVGEPEYNATSKVGIIRIAVSNLGNAKTTVAFAIDAPAGDLVGPSDLVLDTKQSGLAGQRQVATFEFTPPDDEWTTATFNITMRGHAFAASIYKGEPQTALVTFKNNAVDKKDSPPASALLLAPALLGLALWARRRA